MINWKLQITDYRFSDWSASIFLLWRGIKGEEKEICKAKDRFRSKTDELDIVYPHKSWFDPKFQLTILYLINHLCK